MSTAIVAPFGRVSPDDQRAGLYFAVLFWFLMTPFAGAFATAHMPPLFGVPEILLGTVPWSLLLGRLAARQRHWIALAFSVVTFRLVLRIGLGSLVGLIALRLVIVGVNTGASTVMFLGFSLLTSAFLLGSCGSHGSHRRRHRRHRRRYHSSSVWP